MKKLLCLFLPMLAAAEVAAAPLPRFSETILGRSGPGGLPVTPFLLMLALLLAAAAMAGMKPRRDADEGKKQP